MFTSTQLERSIVALVKSDSLAAIESSADLTASGYGDLIRLPSPERTASMKVRSMSIVWWFLGSHVSCPSAADKIKDFRNR